MSSYFSRSYVLDEPRLFRATFIKYGAPIDQKDARATSPLGHVVAADNTDVVRLLLEHGASPFEVLDFLFNAETYLSAALIAGDIDIAELFSQVGVLINLSLKMAPLY